MANTIVVMQPSNSVLEIIRTAKLTFRLSIIVMYNTAVPQGSPYETAIKHIDQYILVDDWGDWEENLSRLLNTVSLDQIKGTYAGLESTLEWDAFLRHKLSLPTTSVENISLLLNKYYVRQTLYKNNLSNIKSYSQQEVGSWDHWPLKNSVYFKPVHGGGSSYVFKINNFKQLTQTILGWEYKDCVDHEVVKRYLEKSNLYFLEEEIKGELMSLEGLTIDGEYHYIGLTSRKTLQQNNVVEIGFGFPYQHKKMEKIVKVVSQAHKLLNIKHGPTHTEVIVTPQGDVEILEINPRLVGADVLITIQQATNKDYTKLLIKLACGENIAIESIKENSSQCAYLQYLMAPKEVNVFDNISFNTQDIVFSRIMAKKGQLITGIQQQNRLAGFIVLANNYEEARLLAKDIANNSKINNDYTPLH